MRIPLHDTGHAPTRDGGLVRVDCYGSTWVATRFTRDLRLHDLYYGTDEQVHTMVEHWRGQ